MIVLTETSGLDKGIINCIALFILSVKGQHGFLIGGKT